MPEPGEAEPGEENGGPKGKEPTRYGDWENKGIAGTSEPPLGASLRSGRDSSRPTTSSTDASLRQQRADRVDDRHVDAERLGGALQHRGGEGAFGHGPAVGEQLGGPGALAEPLPRLKLRELTDEQVRTRSPSPARPASVSARAPLARPKRVISAKPREISAARAFWPSRRPSTTPQAMASTFLTAPPISAPATSSVR